MTDKSFDRAVELKAELKKLYCLISNCDSVIYIGGSGCTINNLFKVSSFLDEATHDKIMTALRDRVSTLESEFNKLS